MTTRPRSCTHQACPAARASIASLGGAAASLLLGRLRRLDRQAVLLLPCVLVLLPLVLSLHVAASAHLPAAHGADLLLRDELLRVADLIGPVQRVLAHPPELVRAVDEVRAEPAVLRQ